jgi:CheY-like chemotaxis protein
MAAKSDKGMAEKSDRQTSPFLVELIRIAPQILWILLVLYIVSLVFTPVITALQRGQGVELKVSEFTLKVVEQRLIGARTAAGTPISREEAEVTFGSLSERIERSRRQLAGATVLWVDDGHPLQNANYLRALGALGISIDTARTTDEAMALLDLDLSYDAIITDLDRPGQPARPCQANSTLPPRAGCDLLARLRERCDDSMPPTIIYAGEVRPEFGTPAYAFGITNRVDRLLTLLLDAFERRPSQSGANPVDPSDQAGQRCPRTPLPPEAAPPGNAAQ